VVKLSATFQKTTETHAMFFTTDKVLHSERPTAIGGLHDTEPLTSGMTTLQILNKLLSYFIVVTNRQLRNTTKLLCTTNRCYFAFL
jgi:hypothetical protein